jgi:hypothetical protein
MPDASTRGATRLTHAASGLTCRFGVEARSNVLQQTPSGFVCSSLRDYGGERLELTYAPGATAEQALKMVADTVSKGYADAKVFPGLQDHQGTDDAGRPLPEHHAMGVTATAANGFKLYVRVSYVIVGDWLIFQRVLGPAGNAGFIDTQADTDFNAEIRAVVAHQAQTPRSSLPAPAQRPF